MLKLDPEKQWQIYCGKKQVNLERFCDAKLMLFLFFGLFFTSVVNVVTLYIKTNTYLCFDYIKL